MTDKRARTKGELEWIKRQAAAKANKPNAHLYFKNIAVTMDGDLCLGMTHDTQHNHYSCSAISTEGVRVNTPLRWDLYGGSLDGLSDLNTDTLQVGIRTI